MIFDAMPMVGSEQAGTRAIEILSIVAARKTIKLDENKVSTVPLLIISKRVNV